MSFPVFLLGEGVRGLSWPGLAGQIAWLAAAVALAYPVWQARGMQSRLSSRGVLFTGILTLIAAAAVLFAGARFPLESPLLVPGRIGRQEEILFLFAAAVPMMLGAGYGGPFTATLVGLVTGAALAFFSTGNPFTILIYGGLGCLAAIFIRQRYRTRFYRLLRRPFFTALALAAVYPVFFLAGAVLGLDDHLVLRLSYGFSALLPEWLAAGASLLVAGLVCEWVIRLFPGRWGHPAALVPSPAERSLETRSFQLMGIFITSAVLALTVVGWAAAHRSATDLIGTRMAGSAELAARNLPNALDTGQSLLQFYLADPRLGASDAGSAESALDEKLETGLYFAELILVDTGDAPIAQASVGNGATAPFSAVEVSGFDLARQGVPYQYYSSGGTEAGAPIVISFIAPVPGSERVLLGRSKMSENPFFIPLLEGLQNLGEITGLGMLIDETGTILHHPVPEMVGTAYAGSPDPGGGLTRSATPDGRPALVQSMRVDGRSWLVLVEVPVSTVHELAFDIAAPFMGLLVALAVTSLITLRLILRVVTGSLRNLTLHAEGFARDRSRLETPIETGGVDEVGRMQGALEFMRGRLKARMDEQAHLLRAGHGAAGSLDFSQAVKPILAAALSNGADSARIILAPDVLPDFGNASQRVFTTGPQANRYAYLDDQILGVMEKLDRLFTRNPIGHPGFSFETGSEIPAGLAAVPLHHEREYLGALWLGYAHRHAFSDDEVPFLATLAAQASLAAANTRLFRSAELERERLGAILESTPDPILVTDRQDRLFLANPAAVRVLGPGLASGTVDAIETLSETPDLLALIRSREEEPAAIEVSPPGGGTYVARVIAFLFNGKRSGKITILRDISHYKELDQVKSNLISNVGHELQQPLAVILGYTTMLTIIGDLNEEQESITGKVSFAVSRMKEMVENLIQMSKIEAGVEMKREEISLVDLTIKAVRERQPLSYERRIQISIAPPSEPIPLLIGDEASIESAIGNLVDNSVKYSNDGGNVLIEFSVTQGGGMVRFSIRDEGIGIQPEDLDQLFDRFYRSSHPEAKLRKGTGLGLAIVKTVVDKHGGRVWVESEPGKGSTFFVELPVAV